MRDPNNNNSIANIDATVASSGTTAATTTATYAPATSVNLYAFLAVEQRAEMWATKYLERESCDPNDPHPSEGVACSLVDVLRADLVAAKELDLTPGTPVKIQLPHWKKPRKETIALFLCERVNACKHHSKDEGLEMIAGLIQEMDLRQHGLVSAQIELPELYYHSTKHDFWHRANSGVWQSVTESTASTMLRMAGLSAKTDNDGSPSEVDRHLISVIQGKGIDAATPLAGYPVGLHEIKDRRILVTHNFHLIEPAKVSEQGDARHIHSIINGLLGAEAPYLMAHLKLSYEALRDFRLTGGLACIICGEVDCGKSLLLDKIITLLLGGRRADTFAFLGGTSTFNDEMIRCEVHTIDDANPFESHEARKRFGNAIKQAVAAGEYWCHPKGRGAFTAPLYRRLFVLINPGDIELMPEMSDSLKGKIMVLKASRFNMPEDSLPLPGWTGGAREKFLSQIQQEMPFFVRDLLGYQIPMDMHDRRFGLMAYQNEEILGMIDEVSSLHEKSTIIQKTLFLSEGEFYRLPEATVEVNNLYDMLLTLEYKDRARSLFRSARALGSALGRLSHGASHGASYQSRRSNGRSYWTILRRDDEIKNRKFPYDPAKPGGWSD